MIFVYDLVHYRRVVNDLVLREYGRMLDRWLHVAPADVPAGE